MGVLIGALAWRISAILTESPQLYKVPLITGAIGVKDRFGDSGALWELIKELEVSAEHIAQKAVELMALKNKELAGVGYPSRKKQAQNAISPAEINVT